MMDAAIFPWMERNVEEPGAKTSEEIDGACRDVWEKVDESMLVKCAERVRRNAKKILDLNGANFYSE